MALIKHVIENVAYLFVWCLIQVHATVTRTRCVHGTAGLLSCDKCWEEFHGD
jgi:hypothetical protein